MDSGSEADEMGVQNVGTRWSPETMVWVTDWGQVVHQNPTCPGISAFGSDDNSKKVPLNDRLCAVRRACSKCFSVFYGDRSLRELNRVIEKLHGKVDFNQKTKTLIATTARLRFGDPTARPPAEGTATAGRSSSGPKPLITSSGRMHARPVPKGQEKALVDEAAKDRVIEVHVRKTANGLIRSSGRQPLEPDSARRDQAPGPASKAEAKRRRDLAAAAKQGISLAELKEQRRRQHQAATAKKTPKTKG